MAKINVSGDMLTITSDFTLESFNKVRRYAPEALKLKDEDGNDLFVMDFNPECHHEVSDNGIVFHSVNANGKMFLTTMNVVVGMHDNLEVERSLITDRYAAILAKIRSIENMIRASMNRIRELEGEVQESICISGELIVESNDAVEE